MQEVNSYMSIIGASAATVAAAANTSLLINMNNLSRHRHNMQQRFMQNNLFMQQERLRRQSESQEYEQTQQQKDKQQFEENLKIFLTEEQKQDEKRRVEERLLDRKFDYALLAWGCNQLICPLDLLDPETWEFMKEECPFCKSCFEITPADWYNGLRVSFGHKGCFTYKENLFNNNPPIEKIIKKLKYKERNIDIMKENFEEYLEMI